MHELQKTIDQNENELEQLRGCHNQMNQLLKEIQPVEVFTAPEISMYTLYPMFYAV